MLYSGQSLDKTNPLTAHYVSPLAFTFVEAKTAKEVKAMSEFVIVPLEDAGDAWKVPFLEDLTDHVENKTLWHSKRIQMIRMMNIAGLSIGRVGYRNVRGKRKIGKNYDSQGNMIDWQEAEVCISDDLFIDIVPPLDFIVDPQATTMRDANWNGHFHVEDKDAALEMFSDGRFSGLKDVEAGDNNMICFYEHFEKILDEWIIYAFPFQGQYHKNPSDQAHPWTEITYLPLSDDHKMLPFFSYHCYPSFADVSVNEGVSRTASGEATSRPINTRDRETFWTTGVPAVIEDMIDLDTDFGRSCWRSLDLAGQTIIATASNYSLDEARPWQSGHQAIGGLNKLQSINLGANININAFEYAFRNLFERMVMATGVDPRNLTENKVKTATEAELQFETESGRLAVGIKQNEEMGETTRGELMVKDEQQYYAKEEFVRLTGKEDPEKLGGYTTLYDAEGEEITIEQIKSKKKIPVEGKRYRRIESSKKLMDKSKEDELYISEEDFGVNSFLAKAEYIRTSDIRINVIPKTRVDQSNAVQFKNHMEALQVLNSTYALTVASAPGMAPAIDANKLPDLGDLIKKIMELLNIKNEKSSPEENVEIKKLLAARDNRNAAALPPATV